MRVSSVTLVGGDHELLGGALNSASNHVDVSVVILTSAVAEASVKQMHMTASVPMIYKAFPWRDDFAAARNASLAAASSVQEVDWALVIDPDERLTIDLDLRQALQVENADVLLTPNLDGSCVKDRIFRLPTRGQYAGLTHECYIPAGEDVRRRFNGVRFWEVAKTRNQLAVKARRDTRLLKQQIERAPADPRWRYYMGQSLEQLGDLENAIHEYAVCDSLQGWREEGAWARFRAADCCLRLGRFVDAVDHGLAGLRREVRPELTWICGEASLALGDIDEAIRWAKVTEVLGNVRGEHIKSNSRIGFSYMPAYYECPFMLLGKIYRALDDSEKAAEADRMAQYAAELRVRSGRLSPPGDQEHA